MTTIEIKNKISKNKIEMVVNVLGAMGISAKINHQDDIFFTKIDFLNKIEKARKSKKTKVSVSNQSSMLGL